MFTQIQYTRQHCNNTISNQRLATKYEYLKVTKLGRKKGFLVCAEDLLPSCYINAVLYTKLGRHMVYIGIKVALMKTNSMGKCRLQSGQTSDKKNRGARTWAF